MTIYKQFLTLLEKVFGRLRAHEAVWKAIRISEDSIATKYESDHDTVQTGSFPERPEVIDNRMQVDHSPTSDTLAYPYINLDGHDGNVTLKTHQDIDISRRDNLEEYAQEITVSQETLQSWVSAGILSPSEIKIAEKLIKIMRDKERSRLPGNNG